MKKSILVILLLFLVSCTTSAAERCYRTGVVYGNPVRYSQENGCEMLTNGNWTKVGE